MARRRRSFKKRSVRSYRRPMFRAKRRRSSKRSGSVKLIQPMFMLYGAARAPISAMFTNKLGSILPFNMAEYTDNIVMGGLSWAAAKYGSGMIKQVGMAGLSAENLLVGADLGNAVFNKTSGSSGSTFLYG